MAFRSSASTDRLLSSTLQLMRTQKDVHERIRDPAAQIRLPDLLMRDLGKLEPGELKAHAGAHVNGLCL